MTHPDELERAGHIVAGVLSRCERESKTEAHTLALRHLRAEEAASLRLILSANREMREALEAKDEAAERDAFEEWYAADMVAFGFTRTTPADVKALRDGPDYGERLALNCKWEGWLARSALTTQRGDGE